MNKTEIKLGIVRKISTAPFESLDITTQIIEVIEWANEKERDQEIDKVQNHLIGDFKKSYASIIEGLEVSRSLGNGKLTQRDGSIHSANMETDSNEVDIF